MGVPRSNTLEAEWPPGANKPEPTTLGPGDVTRLAFGKRCSIGTADCGRDLARTAGGEIEFAMKRPRSADEGGVTAPLRCCVDRSPWLQTEEGLS
jgi:hypothetical protein